MEILLWEVQIAKLINQQKKLLTSLGRLMVLLVIPDPGCSGRSRFLHCQGTWGWHRSWQLYPHSLHFIPTNKNKLLVLTQTPLPIRGRSGRDAWRLFREQLKTYYKLGSRVGAVVRVLAFHQCVPGSIPGLGIICGLRLLVLYSAPRGFSPGTPVFPSPQKPTFDCKGFRTVRRIWKCTLNLRGINKIWLLVCSYL